MGEKNIVFDLLASTDKEDYTWGDVHRNLGWNDLNSGASDNKPGMARTVCPAGLQDGFH